MTDAISAVADGFAALSSGQATVPVRLSVPLRHDGVALTMPAAMTDASCYSVKVVSVVPRNTLTGRPVVMATVLLGDAGTGELLALIDGTALTALRTGAAGGVAARALSHHRGHVEIEVRNYQRDFHLALLSIPTASRTSTPRPRR